MTHPSVTTKEWPGGGEVIATSGPPALLRGPPPLPTREEAKTQEPSPVPRPAALVSSLTDIDFDPEGRLPPFPGLWRPVRSLVWVLRALFGLASLIVLLAVIAAIPLVNFLALGYLLEVEGRVGRTGRLRDGFPLLGLAPRLGMIALGTYLWLIPLRLISTNAAAARIIDPESPATVRMQVIQAIAGAVVATFLLLAIARGGSLGSFLLPVKNIPWLWRQLWSGTYLQTAGCHVGDFVSRLRLRHHFVLGVRGFFAALVWLLVPTLVYASIRNPGGAGALQLVLGIGLLTVAFAWTPFLQARCAAEGRFRAGLQLGEVRDLFRHAPFAWLIAVMVTYVLALPLYLFKAFSPPQDALWPITLIFIATIYPVKLITGWAYFRAVQRRAAGKRSWWLTCTAVRLLGMLPLLALYSFILYFTQFLGAHGKGTLFEHHAFLLPWPYMLGVN